MIYLLKSAPMQTTAAAAVLATGSAIKTLLQFKPIVPARIIAWGISFDGSAAATPGKVELIETDVAATVTAFVNADITKVDGESLLYGDPTTQLISVGVSASGYSASGEGSITAVRDLDGPQLVAPTNQFYAQFPLGQEPLVQANKFARIRVTFGTTVNCYAWIKVSM